MFLFATAILKATGRGSPPGHSAAPAVTYPLTIIDMNAPSHGGMEEIRADTLKQARKIIKERVAAGSSPEDIMVYEYVFWRGFLRHGIVKI